MRRRRKRSVMNKNEYYINISPVLHFSFLFLSFLFFIHIINISSPLLFSLVTLFPPSLSSISLFLCHSLNHINFSNISLVPYFPLLFLSFLHLLLPLLSLLTVSTSPSQLPFQSVHLQPSIPGRELTNEETFGGVLDGGG